VPAGARFCAACGVALEEEPTTVQIMPRHETSPAPPSFDTAMPRYFGITPPMLLFALAVAALATAIVLAVLAHWFAAITLAFVCLLLLVLFVGAAQRKPDTRFARSSARTFGRARERAGWTVESFALRSAAGRETLRLRRELLDLRARRESLLRSLGESVYNRDAAATVTLTEEIRRVDDGAERTEARMHAIAEDTRERLARGRLRVDPTLIEPPQPPSTPEPSPPPDEGTPPQPPIIPEPSPPPDEGTPPTPAPVPEPGPQREI
jgi:hypothetical protein